MRQHLAPQRSGIPGWETLGIARNLCHFRPEGSVLHIARAEGPGPRPRRVQRPNGLTIRPRARRHHTPEWPDFQPSNPRGRPSPGPAALAIRTDGLSDRMSQKCVRHKNRQAVRLCPLSPLAARLSVRTRLWGRGEGHAGDFWWPPHPSPIPRNGVFPVHPADCGGEGAEIGGCLRF